MDLKTLSRETNTSKKDLAKRRLDYWMRKLDLYQITEVFIEAQTNTVLKRILQECGYKVPKIPSQKQKKTRNVRYIHALDCWYGNYRDNKVSVSRYGNGMVAVSGDDDFAMYKEFMTKDEFEDLCSHPISKERCKKLGFKTQ